MSRVRDFRHTAIDVIVILTGIALLLVVGYVSTETAKAQIAAIATSLIGAGLVAYLIRRFHEEPKPHIVEMASVTRVALDRAYKTRKYESKETDILSVALTNVLNEIASDTEDRLLKHVVFDGAKVRLAFVSPLSPYVIQRAAEDGVPIEELRATLRESVSSCVKIYERLEAIHRTTGDKHAHEPHGAGMLVIRAIDFCPYFAIHRTDTNTLWGLYTSAHQGVYSPVFNVQRDATAMFEHLAAHFERLWSLSDDCDVIRYHHPKKPKLERSLVMRLTVDNSASN